MARAAIEPIRVPKAAGVAAGPPNAMLDANDARELAEIVRLLPDVVFRCVKDEKGDIRWTLNEGRLATEFGLTTAQVRGKRLQEMFPPDVVAVVRPHFEAAFRGETATFVNPLAGRHFKHFPQPVRDASGKVVAVVGFITDITDMVEAQARIRALSGDLLARVVQLDEANERLTRANDRLEQANRDLDAFAASVAHDLRTPLTVVRTLAYAIAKGEGRVSAEAAARLERSVQRMDGLITDILAFARASGSSTLPRTRVDLSVMAREVLAELRARDPARQVQVEIQPGLEAQGDPLLVRMLLDNLLGNAWKYTAGTPVAHIALRADGNGWRVEDDGVGFDPAHAAQLFLPFRRLPGSEAFQGTGLGLATAKRVVERHGGAIEGTGRPGKGSVFRFTLAPAPT